MAASPPVADPPARVAIVEDEQAQRGAIAGALQRAGYTVGAWADGADVERIVAFRPDLAILDVMLPGLDGMALARVLRDRDAGAVAQPGLRRLRARAADRPVDRPGPRRRPHRHRRPARRPVRGLAAVARPGGREWFRARRRPGTPRGCGGVPRNELRFAVVDVFRAVIEFAGVIRAVVVGSAGTYFLPAPLVIGLFPRYTPAAIFPMGPCVVLCFAVMV